MVSVTYNHRTGEVTLLLDDDGAQYVAEVMHEEYARSRDRGALDIAEVIEKAINRRREDGDDESAHVARGQQVES